MPPSESGRANWGWDKVLDLNVKAPFYLTRALLPALRAAAKEGDPARVVNVGSVAGVAHQPTPTHAYDASKAALHHLTRKFASELAPERSSRASAPAVGQADLLDIVDICVSVSGVGLGRSVRRKSNVTVALALVFVAALPTASVRRSTVARPRERVRITADMAGVESRP